METQTESFWIKPLVQRDRNEFMAAVELQRPRWLRDEREIARLMNNLQTVDYMVGTPARRRGFSTGRAQVAGA